MEYFAYYDRFSALTRQILPVIAWVLLFYFYVLRFNILAVAVVERDCWVFYVFADNIVDSNVFYFANIVDFLHVNVYKALMSILLLFCSIVLTIKLKIPSISSFFAVLLV